MLYPPTKCGKQSILRIKDLRLKASITPAVSGCEAANFPGSLSLKTEGYFSCCAWLIQVMRKSYSPELKQSEILQGMYNLHLAFLVHLELDRHHQKLRL